MTQEQWIERFEQVQSYGQWAEACLAIKADPEQGHEGDYPDWWWPEMKLTGRMDRILARFGESSELRTVTLRRGSL